MIMRLNANGKVEKELALVHIQVGNLTSLPGDSVVSGTHANLAVVVHEIEMNTYYDPDMLGQYANKPLAIGLPGYTDSGTVVNADFTAGARYYTGCHGPHRASGTSSLRILGVTHTESGGNDEGRIIYNAMPRGHNVGTFANIIPNSRILGSSIPSSVFELLDRWRVNHALRASVYHGHSTAVRINTDGSIQSSRILTDRNARLSSSDQSMYLWSSIFSNFNSNLNAQIGHIFLFGTHLVKYHPNADQ